MNFGTDLALGRPTGSLTPDFPTRVRPVHRFHEIDVIIAGGLPLALRPHCLKTLPFLPALNRTRMEQKLNNLSIGN